ncbi:MAG: hypothetical protein ACRCTD_13695 [Beijerinckiaceae bacterium]
MGLARHPSHVCCSIVRICAQVSIYFRLKINRGRWQGVFFCISERHHVAETRAAPFPCPDVLQKNQALQSSPANTALKFFASQQFTAMGKGRAGV